MAARSVQFPIRFLKESGGGESLEGYAFECGVLKTPETRFRDEDHVVVEKQTAEEARVFRYTTRQELAVQAGATSLRLTISQRNRHSRSLTFPIEWAEGRS